VLYHTVAILAHTKRIPGIFSQQKSFNVANNPSGLSQLGILVIFLLHGPVVASCSCGASDLEIIPGLAI
jgi:hypothetical protein